MPLQTRQANLLLEHPASACLYLSVPRSFSHMRLDRCSARSGVHQTNGVHAAECAVCTWSGSRRTAHTAGLGLVGACGTAQQLRGCLCAFPA